MAHILWKNHFRLWLKVLELEPDGRPQFRTSVNARSNHRRALEREPCCKLRILLDGCYAPVKVSLTRG